MFRKSKKEHEQVEVVKIVHKCSFCKKQDSIGNLGRTYYCASNNCAVKLHKRTII